MTEQTKKLSKTQLKRWKLALKEAAKINRKLKRNKGSILIDPITDEIISVPFSIKTINGISTLGFHYERCTIGFGDNDPNFDNGFMYTSLDEIKKMFKDYRVFKEIKWDY